MIEHRPLPLRFRMWDIIALPGVDNDTLPLSPPFTLAQWVDAWVNTGIHLSEQKNWILMQSTGLKDKNKKEIFEGDILATYEGEEIGWVVAGKVFWWADNIRFILADAEGYMTEDANADEPQEWRHYEIVGNIYENPDKLPKK